VEREAGKDTGWKQYNADDEAFDIIRKDVVQAAHKAGLDNKIIQKLILGMEEAVVNVISYAYEEPGYLWLRTIEEGAFFTLEIADYGIPFNPLEKKSLSHSSVTLRDIEPGGLDGTAMYAVGLP